MIWILIILFDYLFIGMVSGIDYYKSGLPDSEDLWQKYCELPTSYKILCWIGWTVTWPRSVISAVLWMIKDTCEMTGAFIQILFW